MLRCDRRCRLSGRYYMEGGFEMGLFSMSGKKKKGYYGGSSSYGKPGLGGLGGMMGMFGSFSSSARKRQMYQQQMAQQQAAIHQNPVVRQTPQAAPAAAVSAQASSGSIACPACGASVPAGSKFCLECGNKIGGGFCAGCGAALPPGAKFCPACGTPRA